MGMKKLRRKKEIKEVPELKKLHLGCGEIILKDYINVDLYNDKADVKCDVKKLLFGNDSIDEIYACHLIEHFDFHEAFDVLREWKRVLKVGGKLVIETPDLLESCRKFVELGDEDRVMMYSHFFAKPWVPGEIHKFLYTPKQLSWTLMQVGFKNIERLPATRYIGREDICLKMTGIK